jgi:hypothetical protein
MFLTHPPQLDLRVEPAGRSPGAADLHLLRLALDLQVDAMLLTLGAAARAPDDDQVPWRRWVIEDLDAARMLARTLLAGNVDPPAALGTGRLCTEVDSALEDLIARYAAMDDLLRGALRRPYAAQPWRPAAREALTRCEVRLGELHRHRGRAAVRAADECPRFLPGELLG